MAEDRKLMVVVGGLNLNNVNFIQNYSNILRYISNLTVLRCDERSGTILNDDYIEICVRIGHPQTLIGKLTSSLTMQCKIAWRILLEDRRDVYIFFLSPSLFIPIAMLRVMGRKVVVAPGSSAQLLYASRGTPDTFLVMLEERLGYHFCTKAILYSERLIDEWGLARFRDKIVVCPRHYVCTDPFFMMKEYSERNDVIGYVGRLSAEKGVLNLVHAIPAILNKSPEVSFRLIGDGALRTEIESFIDSNGLGDKVQLCGWVDHTRLANSLNDFKILVLPSDTEGLPNVVLEAMACGVVVIASSVGSIPDLIENGCSGYLLEANDPESIAVKVIDALKQEDLEAVSRNAGTFIEENYRLKSAKERYRRLLQSVMGSL